MRALVALIVAVVVWYALLQVLFLAGGAEYIGLTVISVLAVAAGAVAWQQVAKKQHLTR